MVSHFGKSKILVFLDKTVWNLGTGRFFLCVNILIFGIDLVILNPYKIKGDLNDNSVDNSWDFSVVCCVYL